MWAYENKTLEQSNHLSSCEKTAYADKKPVHCIYLHAHKHISLAELTHT